MAKPDRVVVVGIGADGFPGLPETTRATILAVDTVIGGAVQARARRR